MGNGVMKTDTNHRNKTIYIKLLNTSNIQKVIFNGGCSSRDLQDQLSAVCGLPRGSPVLLKDRHGAHITVSPAMTSNTIQDPFVVDTHTYQQILGPGGERDETITNTVAEVAAQLQKVFRIEELKADFGTRISSLEKRLESKCYSCTQI
ncbi:high affinity cGMP-specific 3',5'-cyclic phosphodiesterase 9A-like [Macrobrachium rosenbergii]|uniref:high affinity cGMP-specific 3',5'-cyclic phosphodiesterase 9A-like n=1 Tax=Macrobrachium rosenbergii TaxID=79674 RepID=UPI0034D3AAEE